MRAVRGTGRQDTRVLTVSLLKSVQAEKTVLRAAIMRERSRMSEADHLAAAHGLRDTFLELPQLRDARRVGVYTSRTTEPDTHLLRRALVSRGVDVVQPAIGKTGGLRWLAWPETKTPQLHGALAHLNRWLPHRRAERGDVHLVIAPALAVDTEGRRMGRGRDGYDEILRLLDPATLILAAVHDDELFDSAVEQVPEEPHDVRVDAALTPTRIRYLADRCSL